MKVFDENLNIASFSEKALISRVCGRFGSAVLPSPFGAGDDCAVVYSGAGGKILATVDGVIYGRHFDDSDSARAVGGKLVRRNASDIAAMGGTPFAALAACVYSKNLSTKWLDEFCAGVGETAEKFGIKIVGGDMASVPETYFSAHLTMLGRPPKKILLRTGARAGDKICVTGRLGFSFESGRHLDFEPRLAEGRFLAQTRGVSACTDLSDGTASDLKNILPDTLCAVIDGEKIPFASFDGQTASLSRALCDGEDYELLFAFRGDFEKFKRDFDSRFECGVSDIGVVCEIGEKSEQDGSFCKIFISQDALPPLPFVKEGFSH